MKDLANKHGGFYRNIRILLRSTSGSRLGWVPVDYRPFSKPDRKIATLPLPIVVVMPVRHFITRFFDFMAATLIMFVRHGVL